MEQQRERILKIRNLNISFKTSGGTVKAVRGVNLDLYKGETIAIVGESGSGKCCGRQEQHPLVLRTQGQRMAYA